MALQSPDRRSVLVATATVGASVLAGCLGNASPDSTDSAGDSETTATETPTSMPERPNPSALIDEFLEAAREENETALSEILHSQSPIHPAHFEDTEWEFQGERYEPYDYTNASIVDADASVDDIRDFDGIAFWFQDRKLADVLGNTELRVVSVDVERDASANQPDRWVVAREAGEWRIFWMGQRDETPDDPDAVFEEPIDDEDNDVVANVAWDIDPVDHAGPTPSDRFDYAKVRLTDDPGIEAERIRIESTIANGEFEFYDPEGSETTNSWAGSWANVQIDPASDQIVVTAVQNGSERIVYRGQYRPDEDS